MADRPDVKTASPAVAAVDMAGLASQFAVALGRVPFRRPWSGDAGLWHNLGQNVTREVIRTLMGYTSSLPIEEFRSLEAGLDAVSKVALAPVVRAEGVRASSGIIGGVPGNWYRPDDDPVGTVVYLHGGGYVGTSPNMYAFFTARLASVTGCEVFVADYRLAPEFPFPAGLEDAVAVLEGCLDRGVDPNRLFVAGDSGGGGLAASLIYHDLAEHLPGLAAVIMFSPEVDLRFDRPSVTENADTDILPWNIPTAAYLHGEDAGAAAVTALSQDVSDWPPVFVTWGSDEMFRDSIRALVTHLDEADVSTVSMEADGMFHVYPILMPWADASRRMYAALGDFVRDRVAAD